MYISHAFEAYVLPLAVLIPFGLFAVQSRGTARVAAFFGPVMAIWFIAIAIVGLNRLCGSHGYIGLVTLGAVFLAVTGAEALYADLGHFGRKPIQTAWVWFVFPGTSVSAQKVRELRGPASQLMVGASMRSFVRAGVAIV